MGVSDRKVVEDAFTVGDLPVLCTFIDISPFHFDAHYSVHNVLSCN